MKPLLIAAVAAAVLITAPVQAHESCDAIKTRIEGQIKGHKVAAYSLEIVDKGQAGDAKVIASCDHGRKQIAYKKK